MSQHIGSTCHQCDESGRTLPRRHVTALHPRHQAHGFASNLISWRPTEENKRQRLPHLRCAEHGDGRLRPRQSRSRFSPDPSSPSAPSAPTRLASFPKRTKSSDGPRPNLTAPYVPPVCPSTLYRVIVTRLAPVRLGVRSRGLAGSRRWHRFTGADESGPTYRTEQLSVMEMWKRRREDAKIGFPYASLYGSD